MRLLILNIILFFTILCNGQSVTYGEISQEYMESLTKGELNSLHIISKEKLKSVYKEKMSSNPNLNGILNKLDESYENSFVNSINEYYNSLQDFSKQINIDFAQSKFMEIVILKDETKLFHTKLVKVKFNYIGYTYFYIIQFMEVDNHWYLSPFRTDEELIKLTE